MCEKNLNLCFTPCIKGILRHFHR
uniref:Uncharacterized protein n=1 Tax=Anguilla anguilla TaxID=7936 RepID=A0A0E9SAN1_ANGAN